MAHGTRTRAISGELISGSMADPVTSSEQVWDYSQTDSQNKPRTQEAINAEALGKQDRLVSGTNIKTINNNSLLGSGNITISGGGGAGTLNTTTSNTLAVQSSESLGGSVSLHRVSKTGKYTDLVFGGTGMNQKVLKSGTALSTQMDQEDTIYIIQDDVNISNYTVTVPSGCVLKFEGGKIYSAIAGGGTLVGQDTKIEAGLEQIFGTGVTVSGTWNVPEAYPEWFGATGKGIVEDAYEHATFYDDTIPIQAAVNAFDYVKLTKDYVISSIQVPQFHTVENSRTIVLDGDGYCLEMKCSLLGGVIEVYSSKDYKIEGGVVKLNNGSGTYQTVDTTSYAFAKTVPSAITLADPQSARRARICGIQIFAGKMVTADINGGYYFVGGGKDALYDGLFMGGFICCAVKTSHNKVGDVWNAFVIFDEIDIYGLFYGIIGNIRASLFNIVLEQCFDCFDVYGDLNVINVAGQAGFTLNTGTYANPVYPFPYFITVDGGDNVINEGIYDIGSIKNRTISGTTYQVPYHKYLIKQTRRNIINSGRMSMYRNDVANPTNGDLIAGSGYEYLGGYKHDFLLENVQYSATLSGSNLPYREQNPIADETGYIMGQNLFNPAGDLYLTPKVLNDPTQPMVITVTIPSVKYLFGFTTLFYSNGYAPDTMKIYHGDNVGTANEEQDLVAIITRSSAPYLDWNAMNTNYNNTNAHSFKVVLTFTRVCRLYGMRLYAKTDRISKYGSTANIPTKDLIPGQWYCDTSVTPKRPKFWDGDAWQDMVGVVQIPSNQLISTFNGTQKTINGVTVTCNSDGTFVLSGTASSSGGALITLSEVFTLNAGTYSLIRTVIKDNSVEGTADSALVYLWRSGTEHSAANFNENPTVTLAESTSCVISMNFISGVTYDCTLKLSVADEFESKTVQDAVISLSERLKALENA